MWDILFLAGLGMSILAMIFWPRRDKTVRRTTKSYNSRRLGREKDLY